MCFLAAINPFSNKYWKSDHSSDSGPPITSTNSGVNLNGDCSKPIEENLVIADQLNRSRNSSRCRAYLPKFFGEMLRIKPKSIWIKWPSECNRIFPLCLRNKWENIFGSLIHSTLFVWMHEPVLHLQQIWNQTVGRTTMHEISLCAFEIFRFGTAILVDEILAQAFIGILFDLMQRHCIQNRFDETAVIWETDNLVRSHPQVDVFLFPNQFEHLKCIK